MYHQWYINGVVTLKVHQSIFISSFVYLKRKPQKTHGKEHKKK